MSSSTSRRARPRRLLAIPAALLATSLVAAPVHADPDKDPRGKGAENSARDNKPDPGPKPGRGKPDNPGRPASPGKSGQVPKGPKQVPPGQAKKQDDAPRPPAGGGQAPADTPRGNGEPARGDGKAVGKLPRVVICKYVRKPGVNEVAHHVIIVNANALVGKGFDGTFPHPFSDGQFNSMAIRYAEKGEKAKDVAIASCPSGSEAPPLEIPPVEEPPGDTGGEVEVDPAVAGIDEQAPGGGEVKKAARDGDPNGLLPDTGAMDNLELVALVGGLVTLVGAAMVVAGVRRRRTS